MCLDAGIIAATMHILDMSSKNYIPSTSPLPDSLQNSSPKEQREFVFDIAHKVVEKFILNVKRSAALTKQLAKQLDCPMSQVNF